MTQSTVMQRPKRILRADDIPSDTKVVVKIGASWCRPCKLIAPFFNQMEDEFHDITFLQGDVTDPGFEYDGILAQRAFPSFLFIDRGQIVIIQKGADELILRSNIELLMGETLYCQPKPTPEIPIEEDDIVEEGANWDSPEQCSIIETGEPF